MQCRTCSIVTAFKCNKLRIIPGHADLCNQVIHFRNLTLAIDHSVLIITVMHAHWLVGSTVMCVAYGKGLDWQPSWSVILLRLCESDQLQLYKLYLTNKNLHKYETWCDKSLTSLKKAGSLHSPDGPGTYEHIYLLYWLIGRVSPF